MSNLNDPINIISLVLLNIIFMWGTYKLTRPYKPEKDKTECKCTK
jgi:hypothetical protein